MSRRDDRDRAERNSARRDVDQAHDNRRQQPVQRQNEYFQPKQGIDREVITADICRYLGPDALVRPGYQLDQQTRTQVEGYYINAYRNLTSAMIATLKADSLRWDTERRNTRTPYATYEQYAPPYTASQTHHNRQEQLPASTMTSMTSLYTASPPVGTGYDETPYRGNQQAQYGSNVQSGYTQPTQDYPMGGQPDYVYGAAYIGDNSTPGRGRIPVSQPPASSYGRETQYASSNPVYPATTDPRYVGYSQPSASTSSYVQPGQHATESPYGRGTSYEQSSYSSTYDNYGDDGRGYVDQNQYSQSMAASQSTTVTADPNPTRRPHGDRHGHSKHPRSDNRRT